MDSMKDRQKPSAGYRDAEHLSMLCDAIVAELVQAPTKSSSRRKQQCRGIGGAVRVGCLLREALFSLSSLVLKEQRYAIMMPACL